MSRFISAFLYTALALLVGPTQADYFDDQGNIVGRFRTDYNSTTEGSSSNPLVIGTTCLYPVPGDPILLPVHRTQQCPAGPTVYPGGPFPYSNTSTSSYFVISANVELSFDTTILPGIQGAPNRSSSLTGSPDLLNFFMLPVMYNWNPIKWKAHLFVDNEGVGGPKFAEALPFLGIGAQKSRGNAGNVGQMNTAGAPKRTTWNSTINIATGTPTGELPYVLAHQVYAIANWGGIPRMLVVSLFHHMVDFSNSSNLPGGHKHWNWKAENSFYYPGADIAYIDAEDIFTHCGSGVGTVPRITSIGVKTTYSLNWEFLYRCMSNNGLFDTPMPTSSVPLLGVHWASEVAFNASLWATIEDMRMAP